MRARDGSDHTLGVATRRCRRGACSSCKTLRSRDSTGTYRSRRPRPRHRPGPRFLRSCRSHRLRHSCTTHHPGTVRHLPHYCRTPAPTQQRPSTSPTDRTRFPHATTSSVRRTREARGLGLSTGFDKEPDPLLNRALARRWLAGCCRLARARPRQSTIRRRETRAEIPGAVLA